MIVIRCARCGAEMRTVILTCMPPITRHECTNPQCGRKVEEPPETIQVVVK